MNIKFNLSDRKKIELIEKDATKMAKYPVTLTDQILNWKKLCENIRDGYKDLFEEYANDLSSRTIIKNAIDSLSAEGKQTLCAIIQPMDEIFLENTINIGTAILDYDDISKDIDFWFYRVPQKMNKDSIESFEESLGFCLPNDVTLYK